MEVRLRKQWIVRIANLDTVPKSTLWLQAGQLIPAEVVNRPIQIAELPISVVDALRAMLLDQGVEDVLYQNSRIQMRPNRMDAVAIYGIPIAMQMNEGVMKTNFMSIAHLWFTGSQLTLLSLLFLFWRG
ncbi:MAG TPA: hypothetical protein EYP10_01555 [Armatimonadetes bacterium]|nr:hypothetical protein [Armatimonadota bacterium]